MTLLQPHAFACPLCGAAFESQVVAQTDSFGRQHSDLYKEAEGVQPVCYFVHTCPECGYSGYEGDFSPQAFDPAFREMVCRLITPEVKARPVGTNGNFYLAALCADGRGAPAGVVARIYHMGAWCYRMKADRDGELFFLLEAQACFERALRQDETPPEDLAVYTYLAGDIARRLGDPARASGFYGKVEQVLREHGGDPRIGEFARRQIASPSDYL